MKVPICEACGVPIWGAAEGQVLCDLCMQVVDAQVELLIELGYLEDDCD